MDAEFKASLRHVPWPKRVRSDASKLADIRAFIHRRAQAWIKRYGPGIRAIHIAKKSRAGEILPYYSIVFMVARKKSFKGRAIPSRFRVRKSGGGHYSVASDVIVTGPYSPHGLRPGGKVKDESSSTGPGTIGFFCHDQTRLYVCTNAHVIAPRALAHGRYENPGVDEANEVEGVDNVSLTTGDYSTAGTLWRAVYGPVDAAIAWIRKKTPYSHVLPEIGPIMKEKGSPDDSWRDEVPVRMFSRRKGYALHGFIREPIMHPVPVGHGKVLEELMLIQWDNGELSEDGDSGSAILGPRNRLIGILVGKYKAGPNAGLSVACPIELVKEHLRIRVLHSTPPEP